MGRIWAAYGPHMGRIWAAYGPQVKQQSEAALRHQLETATQQLAAALEALGESAAEVDRLKAAPAAAESSLELREQVGLQAWEEFSP
jgi:hypothetical protein